MKTTLLTYVVAAAVLFPLASLADSPRLERTPKLFSSLMVGETPFFLRSAAEDAETVHAALPQAHFVLKRGGVEQEQRPATLRPATVGDALANWSGYCRAMRDDEGNADRREVMERLSPGELLPLLWVAEVPELTQPGERWELHLPAPGRAGLRNISCKDLIVGSVEMPPYSLSLESETLGRGRFRVTLHATQPMAAEAFEEGLAGLTPMVSASGGSADCHLERQADGTWMGEAGRCRIRLSLDREATEAAARELSLADGRRVKGYGRAVFMAETEGETFVLSFAFAPPSVYDQQPLKGEPGAMSTRLKEATPYVISSLRASALREGGRREILYRCGFMRGLRARVRRFANTGEIPVRLLRDYRAGYLSTNEVPPQHEWKTIRGAIPQPHLMSTEFLGGELRECPLPLNEEGRRGHFDPCSLYPEIPARGLYFVELIGEPLAGLGTGSHCVTQSVVQVTDLGLYWHQGAHGLLAYAYHLSDSSVLAEGELLLLDINGQPLARYGVKDGFAKGALPAGTCYLQLRSGDDAFTAELNEHGSPVPEARQHYDWEGLRAGFFTDRKTYRRGDTVHIGGFVRAGKPGKYKLPRDVCARLHYSYTDNNGLNHSCSQPLPIDEAGVVNASLKLGDWRSLGDLRVVLSRSGAEQTSYLFPKLVSQSTPSAQLDGGFSLLGDKLHAWLGVMRADGSSPGGTEVVWSFNWRPIAFAPKGFDDYHFGTDLLQPESPRRFLQTPLSFRSARGVLDDSGFAELDLHDLWRGENWPSRHRATLQAEIPLGYGQTLRHSETLELDPASIYVGMRRASRISRVGDTLELDLALVQADGRRYEGSPVPVTLRVQHIDFPAASYSLQRRSGACETGECCRALLLPAEGLRCPVELPAEGCYRIIVEGKDAEGRRFASVINQNVWSGEGAAPWLHEDDDEGLVLEPDKRLYHVGDTARVLVSGVIEGEAVVTVESRRSQRSWRCPVSPAQKWVEIPIIAEDGTKPMVYVTLVQGKGVRPASGLPYVQLGQVQLTVAQQPESLRIELPVAPQGLRPGESWEMVGRVLDAEGKPAAGAAVLLYAVDRGVSTQGRWTSSGAEMTVQERQPGALERTFMGVDPVHELPEMAEIFMDKGSAPGLVHRRLGRLTPDVLHNWEFGNKGIFVGGRGAAEAPAPGSEGACVLWERLTADEQGLFRCRFTAPGSHADYRLVAVAAAGTELFGTAHSAIRVERPVALMPEFPAVVHVGDKVALRLRLRAGQLPEGAGELMRWRVSLTRGEGAEAEQREHLVQLRPGEEKLLDFPVRFPRAGLASLSWRVAPAEEQPAPEGMEDVLTQHLLVEKVEQGQDSPDAPRLQRRYERLMPDGSWQETTHFKRGDYVRVTVSVFNYPDNGHAYGELRDAHATGMEALSYGRDGSFRHMQREALACQQASSWRSGYSSPYDFMFNGVKVQGKPRDVSSGEEGYRFCYIARLTEAGEFTIPPASLWMSFNRRALGRPDHITVEP